MLHHSTADIYLRKLNHAKRLINVYNYLREPTPDGKRVVYEEFLQQLLLMGGSSNEMLLEVTSEDLELIGLPVLMARRLAEIFQLNNLDFDISPEGAVISKGGSDGSLQR